MALIVKFEAETGNDGFTPNTVAQAIVNVNGITSQDILDIAAHLNIIGRSMRKDELTRKYNEVAEEL